MDMKDGLFTDPGTGASQMPIVMGHEAAGVVAAVADGVTDVKVGDEVAVHPVMPCYECVSCKRGLSHLCDDMGHLCFNRPGVFSEYFATRPDCIRKIPPGMTFALASLMEPVCVCMEAVNRGRVKEGSRILIAGDGPFGIMISKLCALKNPKQIIQTGLHEYRLKHAGQVPGLGEPQGATIHTINIRENPNTKEGQNGNGETKTKEVPELVKTITGLTDGEGIDTAILCVSDPAAVDLCVEVLRSRGILVIFSALNEKTPVDLFRVHLKELNILGSNNDENYMDEAMRLLNDPSMGFQSIITHEIPFEQWEEAFRLADEGKGDCLKVTMTF